MDLKEALTVLLKEERLDSFIYDVRERTFDDPTYKGNSWDHPRVKRCSEALGVIEHYLEFGE